MLEALDLWWTTAANSMRLAGRTGEGEDAFAVCEEEYVQVSMKIYKAMIQPYDEVEAEANARKEWNDDTRGRGLTSERLPNESFKDAIFELADLWTAGIDSVEYAAFLLQLFHRIAEGQPPDAYLWLPTDRITHGGYTSPKKMRRDELPPPPNSRDTNKCMQVVDFLRLDDANEVAEESHTMEQPLCLGIVAPDDDGAQAGTPKRSPLRGGRTDGFTSDAEANAAELAQMERRRPTSSPVKRPADAKSDRLVSFSDAAANARGAARLQTAPEGRRRRNSKESMSLGSRPGTAFDSSPSSMAADPLDRAPWPVWPMPMRWRPPTAAGLAENGIEAGVTHVQDAMENTLLKPGGRHMQVKPAMHVLSRSNIPPSRNGTRPALVAPVSASNMQLNIEGGMPANDLYGGGALQSNYHPMKAPTRQPLSTLRPNGVTTAVRRMQKAHERARAFQPAPARAMQPRGRYLASAPASAPALPPLSARACTALPGTRVAMAW